MNLKNSNFKWVHILKNSKHSKRNHPEQKEPECVPTWTNHKAVMGSGPAVSGHYFQWRHPITSRE